MAKGKRFFTTFWDYIKSIIKPIRETFAWIGSSVSKVFPLKEFENRNTSVVEKIGSRSRIVTENSIFKNGNAPLTLHSSISKELLGKNIKLENGWLGESFKNKTEATSEAGKILEKFTDESYVREPKTVNKTQNYHFNISVQATPNQDTRSLADEVIRRIREQSRDVLFFLVDYRKKLNLT